MLSIILGFISCGTENSLDLKSKFDYPKSLDKETLHEIDNGHRNGEGSFILLSDDKLAYVYTCFNTNSTEDNSTSNICMITSDTKDRKTWTKPIVLVPNHGLQNVMSVSLLRLENDDILIQYLEKNSCNDLKVIRRYSSSELETISKIYVLNINDGYNVVNNDRILYYDSKIYTPISRHSCENGIFQYRGTMELSISGNEDKLISIPTDSNLTFQEPGIVNLSQEGEELLMWFRNSTHKMYISISTNLGDTFSQIKESIINTVPYSPSSMKLFNNDLFIIYNKWTERTVQKERTPLVLSISKDKLKSIYREYVLEEDKSLRYMYTSIYKENKDLILAYMIQNKENKFRLKIIRINEIMEK